jgi:hypothetical protein
MSFYCARELQLETGKPYSKYYTDGKHAYDLAYADDVTFNSSTLMFKLQMGAPIKAKHQTPLFCFLLTVFQEMI